MPKVTNLTNVGAIEHAGHWCAVRRTKSGRLYVWSPRFGRIPFDTPEGQEFLLENTTMRTGTGDIAGAPAWIVNNARPERAPVPDKESGTDPEPVPVEQVPEPVATPEPAPGTGTPKEGATNDGSKKSGWRPIIDL